LLKIFGARPLTFHGLLASLFPSMVHASVHSHPGNISVRNNVHVQLLCADTIICVMAKSYRWCETLTIRSVGD